MKKHRDSGLYSDKIQTSNFTISFDIFWHAKRAFQICKKCKIFLKKIGKWSDLDHDMIVVHFQKIISWLDLAHYFQKRFLAPRKKIVQYSACDIFEIDPVI